MRAKGQSSTAIMCFLPVLVIVFFLGAFTINSEGTFIFITRTLIILDFLAKMVWSFAYANNLNIKDALTDTKRLLWFAIHRIMYYSIFIIISIILATPTIIIYILVKESILIISMLILIIETILAIYFSIQYILIDIINAKEKLKWEEAINRSKAMIKNNKKESLNAIIKITIIYMSAISCSIPIILLPLNTIIKLISIVLIFDIAYIFGWKVQLNLYESLKN